MPIQHVRKRSISNNHSNDSQNTIHSNDDVLKQTKRPYKSRTFDNSRTNLHLKAFGKPFNLTLVPTEGLFRKGKLKIWTIEPNATAQHGVEYVELPEVRILKKKIKKKSVLVNFKPFPVGCGFGKNHHTVYYAF